MYKLLFQFLKVEKKHYLISETNGLVVKNGRPTQMGISSSSLWRGGAGGVRGGGGHVQARGPLPRRTLTKVHSLNPLLDHANLIKYTYLISGLD